MGNVTMSVELLNKVVNKLAEQPFHQVAELIEAIRTGAVLVEEKETDFED